MAAFSIAGTITVKRNLAASNVSTFRFSNLTSKNLPDSDGKKLRKEIVKVVLLQNH